MNRYPSPVCHGARSMVATALCSMCATFFSPALEGQSTTVSAPSTLEVVYLANEGFALSSRHNTVLIDALFGAGIAGYPAVPKNLRNSIESGINEFENVHLALATHVHADHFDAQAVARFLTNSASASFLSTPQSIESLQQFVGKPSALDARISAVLPTPGTSHVVNFEGGNVEIFNLHHGPRKPPIENLGFVVELGGLRISHFGDTEAKQDDFAPILDRLRNIDVALLPFWFLTSEWRAEMVKRDLQPRAMIVAHLPNATAASSYFGRWRTHEAVVSLIETNFPNAIIPERSGQSWTFESVVDGSLETLTPPQ